MKYLTFLCLSILAFSQLSMAVSIDEEKLGASLGGWDKKGGKSAEYELSGAKYRTYKPEITPTPDGGIYVSIRIDHMRGLFSSDDHAVLEITLDSEGNMVSAQSSIAIQGRSVSSDLIRGGAKGGAKAVGVDRAVEIGTTMIADISAKMLQEKIVEAGRVSFPAVIRHNYNLLYQAIKADTAEIPKALEVNLPENPKPKASELEIKGFGADPEKEETEKK